MLKSNLLHSHKTFSDIITLWQPNVKDVLGSHILCLFTEMFRKIYGTSEVLVRVIFGFTELFLPTVKIVYFNFLHPPWSLFMWIDWNVSGKSGSSLSTQTGIMVIENRQLDLTHVHCWLSQLPTMMMMMVMETKRKVIHNGILSIFHFYYN